MKKRKITNGLEEAPMQNPVAKFAHRFNKAQVFTDKKHYSRKIKHGKQEVSPFVSAWNGWRNVLNIVLSHGAFKQL